MREDLRRPFLAPEAYHQENLLFPVRLLEAWCTLLPPFSFSPLCLPLGTHSPLLATTHFPHQSPNQPIQFGEVRGAASLGSCLGGCLTGAPPW